MVSSLWIDFEKDRAQGMASRGQAWHTYKWKDNQTMY
jgi:hypothetical protein